MIIIEVKKIDILSLLKANRFIIDEKLVNDIIFKISNKSGIDLKDNKDIKKQVICKSMMIQRKWRQNKSGRFRKDFTQKIFIENFNFRITETVVVGNSSAIKNFLCMDGEWQLCMEIENLHENLERLRLNTLKEICNFKKKNEKKNDNFSELIESITLKVENLKIDFDLVKNFEKILIK